MAGKHVLGGQDAYRHGQAPIGRWRGEVGDLGEVLRGVDGRAEEGDGESRAREGFAVVPRGFPTQPSVTISAAPDPVGLHVRGDAGDVGAARRLADALPKFARG